jgi:hypothetical protein
MIEELPDTDNVTLLGLPANIDQTMQRNTSNNIISQMQKLMLESQKAHGFNKEQWNIKLSPIVLLWKKVKFITYPVK